MALDAAFAATITATTAASGTADKTTALITGYSAALRKLTAEAGPLTPRQQAHFDAATANAITNIADFVTAMGG